MWFCRVKLCVNYSCLRKNVCLSFTRRHSYRNMLKLKARGMYQDVFPENSNEEIVELLKRGGPQCVYSGFDPTADSLHIGNLLVLINLLHWQRAGHHVILLVGGATGRIGDPSGRTADRPVLEAAHVDENACAIKRNIEQVFNNHKHFLWKQDTNLLDIRIVNNMQWYEDASAVELVASVGRHLRMGAMLSRHSVQTRLSSSSGMSFTEFCYQLFQSYDWLKLLQLYDCRFQVGGNDQMGNIVSGHDLISRVTGTKVYGLTLPLITTESGDKFGKSAGNAVWLDPAKTSPFELYQFFMRVKDCDVEKLLKLFTFESLGVITDLMESHKPHNGPMPSTMSELPSAPLYPSVLRGSPQQPCECGESCHRAVITCVVCGEDYRAVVIFFHTVCAFCLQDKI